MIFLDFKDDAERRLLRQTMNKLRGGHDLLRDAAELKVLYDAGRLDDLTHLLAADKDSFLRILNRRFDVPWVPEVNSGIVDIKERIKLGEVWQLGKHRVACGDATDPEVARRLLQGVVVDLLLTDPPYGIAIVEHHDDYIPESSVGTLRNPFNKRKFGVLREDRSSRRLGRAGQIGGAAVAGFRDRKEKDRRVGSTDGANPYSYGQTLGVIDAKGLIYPRVYKVVEGYSKPFDPRFLLAYGSTQVIFGGNHYAHLLPQSHHWIIWDKRPGGAFDTNSTTFSDAEIAWTNVQRRNPVIYRQTWAGMTREGPRDEELPARIHPTQKPVGLMAMILQDYSKKGASVLDLFAGSGSTLIACEKLERACYACEIDPYYCSLILKRWEDYTGGEASLSLK